MAGVTKLDKIKNLATFSNFAWNASLEPLKQFNLIFGWNGTGKTALSRLFASLEAGQHKEFPELEYQVTLDEAKFKHGESVPTKVRVFNIDYVERNVGVVENGASPIYVLGEKSQETLAEIKKDEATLNGISGDAAKPGLLELLRRATEDEGREKAERDKLFSSIAKTISASRGSGGALRSYRAPNAKAAFDQLQEKVVLNDEELKTCELTIGQPPEQELALIAPPSFSLNGQSIGLIDALPRLTEDAKKAFVSTAQSVAIARLIENEDIAQWVEQGVDIHRKYSSSSCEFCQQTVPQSRWDALNDHFSEADRELKDELARLAKISGQIRAALAGLKLYDRANLCRQFRDAYASVLDDIARAQDVLTQELHSLEAALSDKKARTTESVAYDCQLDSASLVDAIEAVNGVIAEHNDMASNLEKAQDAAAARLENHYLSTIFDEVKEKDARLLFLSSQIDVLTNGKSDDPSDLGVVALQQRIAANRAKVSSAHKSCIAINGKLRDYFGRDELAFEVKSDAAGKAVGYILKRNGKLASGISEGERTAIAFAHFSIQLTEQEFDIKQGIVVIDDPISSLDSAMLFKVCASIQRQLLSAGQLVLLTHNFDFFNQMKKWFRNEQKIRGEGENPKPNYRLLMLQSRFDKQAGKRISIIADLDPMLRDHESEYHYLFKSLLKFDEENAEGASLSAIYDYPNLARKLLECYLSFRVPTGKTLYRQLHELKVINKNIDTEKVKFVYEFINSHSHLNTKDGLIQFDPTLSVSGPDAIKATLSLIELSDEKHYKAMVKAVAK